MGELRLTPSRNGISKKESLLFPTNEKANPKNSSPNNNAKKSLKPSKQKDQKTVDMKENTG